jgi:hypothetical protein
MAIYRSFVTVTTPPGEHIGMDTKPTEIIQFSGFYPNLHKYLHSANGMVLFRELE